MKTAASAISTPTSAPTARAPRARRTIALAGNPNSGKTTLFNALTGLRAKVGNYPGVTVERKEGRLTHTPPDRPVVILDLPGAYSLSPQSMDEQITRDVLFRRLTGVPVPDAVVALADASNLQRNLYFVTQIIEMGYPTVVALNMMDVAEANGLAISPEALSRRLGVEVIPVVASQGQGMEALRAAMERALEAPAPFPAEFTQLPEHVRREWDALAESLPPARRERPAAARSEARLILHDERFLASSPNHYPAALEKAAREARSRLEHAGIDWRSAAIESRYQRIAEIQAEVTVQASSQAATLSDRLDAVLTHRVWGVLAFLGLMALIFQSIFTFAQWPMTWLDGGVSWVGAFVAGGMPEGPLRSLLVDGVIAGVGAVVVFLPQICLLFLFIGLMEDTGYMARAAFLMDRLMSKVGLHGKSFIPMLSSFACAIPGIMATRTIENPKDRLATILVAPLMSCSARLPVYTVLIGACIPPTTLFGVIGLRGLTLLGMYLLGIVAALIMAWIFKSTLLRGPTPMLIMELPPYKRPLVRVLLRHMWDRSGLFLRRAGTVILGIAILLWFLMSYPKLPGNTETQPRGTGDVAATAPADPPQEQQQAQARAQDQEPTSEQLGEQLRHSYAGRVGHALEPLILPLGFDWKIGIGLVASFAAREVFVSAMSQVYNQGMLDDSEEGTQQLVAALQEQRRDDGTRLYSISVGLALMVFYVFALQCVSTVAVVRRETNGWRWPLFQWVYMGVLAWIGAWITYRLARIWLGP